MPYQSITLKSMLLLLLTCMCSGNQPYISWPLFNLLLAFHNHDITDCDVHTVGRTAFTCMCKLHYDASKGLQVPYSNPMSDSHVCSTCIPGRKMYAAVQRLVTLPIWLA